MAIHTMPTGLASEPPPGPATPDVARPQVAPMACFTPLAMALTTASLTAPFASKTAASTPKASRLTSLL